MNSPRPPSNKQRPLWASVILAAIAAIGYFLRGGSGNGGASAPDAVDAPRSNATPTTSSIPVARPASSTDGGILSFFRERTSDQWVEASGRVVKVLPDDNETDGGQNDRHQRLLVEVRNARESVTVLVSHNIDAAPRVPVKEGDSIRFRGEYEWTEKGGTIHFTHKSKYANSTKGGWVEAGGKRYD